MFQRRRALASGLSLVLVAAACGSSRDNAPGDARSRAGGSGGGSAAAAGQVGGDSGGTAGRSALAGAGGMDTPGAGGSAGSAISGGDAGDAGSASAGAGSGGDAGTGPEPDVLAALETDDATLEALAGKELFALALEIGFARGWALCSCLAPADWDTADTELMTNCARAEAGFSSALFDPMVARCVTDLAPGVPAFDESLRCQSKRLREVGRAYVACSPKENPLLSLPPLPDCQLSEAVTPLLDGLSCGKAYYCEDGTFAQYGHCDARADCIDAEDERSCADHTGRDTFICQNELSYASEACINNQCVKAASPALCDPDLPDRFLCGDETSISIHFVCDRREDCATARDEAYCLR